jgi:hypothetical protein
MDQFPPFKITISSALSPQEREILLLIFKSNTTLSIQTPENRAFGIDDYLLIVGAVAATAEAIKAVGELVEKLIEWRNSLKQSSQVTLEKIGKKPLDLKSASDEEIREWFSK